MVKGKEILHVEFSSSHAFIESTSHPVVVTVMVLSGMGSMRFEWKKGNLSAYFTKEKIISYGDLFSSNTADIMLRVCAIF